VAQSDRQRREFFRPAEVGWEPPIDVLETKVELVVVALPGVRANEVEVVIGSSELAIVARDAGRRRCVWPARTGWNCRTSLRAASRAAARQRRDRQAWPDGRLPDQSSTKALLMDPAENATKPVCGGGHADLTPGYDAVLLPGAMMPLAAARGSGGGRTAGSSQACLQAKVLRLSHGISQQTRATMEGRQREFLLRELSKTIQKELGEADDRSQDLQNLKRPLEQVGMPDEVAQGHRHNRYRTRDDRFHLGDRSPGWAPSNLAASVAGPPGVRERRRSGVMMGQSPACHDTQDRWDDQHSQDRRKNHLSPIGTAMRHMTSEPVPVLQPAGSA
jgi:hypothetical protein